MSDKVKTLVFIQMAGSKTGSGTGGGIAFQEVLAKSLLEKGINVYAISNPSDTYGFRFLGSNRLVANFSKHLSGLGDLLWFDRKRLKSEIRSLVSSLPEDALFVTVDPFPADILAASVIKMSGRRVIITIHHITPSPLFHPIRRGTLRSMVAWIISLNALIFVKIGNVPFFLDNKRIASELGWKFGKNMMEMPLALPTYASEIARKRKKKACFLGRLAKNKGVVDIIRAWSLVKRQDPDAILYIIGKDYGKGKYQRLVSRYKLHGSILITGFLEEQAKLEIMRECSLFIFPSYEEGWSLAVMEAVDAGLLPIVYDIPAYDYLCSHENKVRVSDIKELASKVVHYFNHEDERLQLVAKLQRCISAYTIESVTDLWIEQVESYFSESEEK